MQTESGTDINKAGQLLREGHCVGIPTETVYGLAANALDKESVLKIFHIKNRPDFDPLIVHAASLSAAERLCSGMHPMAIRLAEKFWPGPLTLVLPKSEIIPEVVTSGLPTVGVRVPDHSLTLELLASLEFPLAAPSANPFGYVSPTTAMHVFDQLNGRIPYILDGGACRVGIESTIVSFGQGVPVILRKGQITREMIEEITGPVSEKTHSSSNPQAPGMLESHYATRTPISIYRSQDEIDPDNTGFIAFAEKHPGIPGQHQVILSGKRDLHEAARSLYAAMRKLDQLGLKLILIQTVPETGIGVAVNDRIRRATAKSGH